MEGGVKVMVVNSAMCIMRHILRMEMFHGVTKVQPKFCEKFQFHRIKARGKIHKSNKEVLDRENTFF